MPTHEDIAIYLNRQNFNALNQNMQNAINFITGGISNNPIIYCNVITDTFTKPNLELNINNQNYYLSVLSGDGNSVHEEQPSDIIAFMRNYGATTPMTNFMHDLCYTNDHTTNFISHQLIINPTLVQDVRNFFYTYRTPLITRAMQNGIYGGQPSQFIYWGNENHGYIQSINYVINRLSNTTSNTRLISVGGLSLQRKDRFVNHNIQLKWPHPANDLI